MKTKFMSSSYFLISFFCLTLCIVSCTSEEEKKGSAPIIESEKILVQNYIVDGKSYERKIINSENSEEVKIVKALPKDIEEKFAQLTSQGASVTRVVVNSDGSETITVSNNPITFNAAFKNAKNNVIKPTSDGGGGGGFPTHPDKNSYSDYSATVINLDLLGGRRTLKKNEDFWGIGIKNIYDKVIVTNGYISDNFINKKFYGRSTLFLSDKTNVLDSKASILEIDNKWTSTKHILLGNYPYKCKTCTKTTNWRNKAILASLRIYLDEAAKNQKNYYDKLQK